MNTYILPCYSLDDGDLWLEKVRARSFTEAEDKFIDLFITDYDELAGTMAKDKEIIIGDIYDIEEF